MAKFHFRYIAIDQTEYWRLEGTPVEGMMAFGVFVFCEGEATFCCSLTPSSWCEWREDVFLAADGSRDMYDLEDQEREEVEEMSREANPGGESDTYFSYIDMRYQDKRFVSKRFTVEIDMISDHKTAEKTWKDVRNSAREAAWQETHEFFASCGREVIPVLDTRLVLRDYLREQSPRVIARLPLFAWANNQPPA